ncbi:unnamed protein product [Caenorhabditis nigoni]
MDYLVFIVILPAVSIIFDCCGKKKRKEKVTTPSKEVKDFPVTPASPEIVQKPEEMAKDKTKSMKSEKNSEKKTKSEDKKSNDSTDVEKGNKTKSEKEKKTEEEKKKDNEDKEKEMKNEPKKNDEKQAVISDPIVTPETDEYPTLEDDVEKSKNKVKTAKEIDKK